MDIENLDLKQYRGRSGGPVLKNDPWDGVKGPGPLPDGREICVYCGHDHQEHGGESAMYLRAGRKKRTRLGLLIYWCDACAREKGTSQVICYSAPSGLLDRIEKSDGKLAL